MLARMSAPHCSRCTAQCCRLTVVLDATECIPPQLTTRIAGGLRVMAKDADGWCAALDRTSMNCGIYDERPQVCRRFMMAGPYCRAIFAGAADDPPGR